MMLVERLTYHQATKRLEAATKVVEDLEDELRDARRRQRRALDEMHHALHERLERPLP